MANYSAETMEEIVAEMEATGKTFAEATEVSPNTVYRIYARKATFGGHLHTVKTREQAEAWVKVFTRQGYTDLYITEDED